MKTQTIVILGLGVAAVAAVLILRAKAQANVPPVSGTATGPTAGTGVQGMKPGYGNKYVGTASNLLEVGKQGLDLYAAWNTAGSAKPLGSK